MIRLRWSWRDPWLGARADQGAHRVFICLLPTLVIEIGIW